MDDSAANLPDALQSLLAAAPSVEISEPDPEAAHRAIEGLGLSGSTMLGEVLAQTGGLVIDAGWLRIVGSGSPLVPRCLDTWNGLPGTRRNPDGLLVGDDAIGGFFLLMGDGENVHYLAPDSLECEDLGVDYGTWLAWCLGAGPGQFYEEERWDGWRSNVAELGPDEVFQFHPPLAAEGPDIGKRKRKAVPVGDAYDATIKLQRSLDGLAEGQQFTMDPKA